MKPGTKVSKEMCRERQIERRCIRNRAKLMQKKNIYLFYDVVIELSYVGLL